MPVRKLHASHCKCKMEPNPPVNPELEQSRGGLLLLLLSRKCDDKKKLGVLAKNIKNPNRGSTLHAEWESLQFDEYKALPEKLCGTLQVLRGAHFSSTALFATGV